MPITVKRSPSYPRIDLNRAIELAKKVYDATFETPIDTETLYGLMGYSGRSGPSASALSALKQYKLVEGRDQALNVTPLAVRILHPATEREKADALAEAVLAPQLYNEINVQFSGKIPSDQVLKSYLVRVHRFNPNGADELIRVLRENRAHMERAPSVATSTSSEDVTALAAAPIRIGEVERESIAQSQGESEFEGDEERKEILRFRVSPSCLVRIIFAGPVTRSGIEKTIQFLDLAKDQYAES